MDRFGTGHGQTESGSGHFGRWLAGAFALHGMLLLGVGAWGTATPTRQAAVAVAARSVTTPAAELSIELEQDVAPSIEAAPTTPELTPRVAGEVAPPAARASASAARTEAATPAGDGSGEEEVASQPAPTTTAPGATPRRLTLAQLGVGAPSAALALDVPAVSNVTRAEQRLNDSLATGLALEDSSIGLGFEGPAVRAIGELVLDSSLPLSTTARLLLVINATGATEAVSVLESGPGGSEWQRIAEALRKRLATRTLRLPLGSAGASLQLDVASLPLSQSGARAGLDAEIFGQGKAPPGTPSKGRLSVLPRQAATARSQFPWLEIGSHPQPMGGFSNNVASGSADLSDIGGGTQRSVRARLAQVEMR